MLRRLRCVLHLVYCHAAISVAGLTWTCVFIAGVAYVGFQEFMVMVLQFQGSSGFSEGTVRDRMKRNGIKTFQATTQQYRWIKDNTPLITKNSARLALIKLADAARLGSILGLPQHATNNMRQAMPAAQVVSQPQMQLHPTLALAASAALSSAHAAAPVPGGMQGAALVAGVHPGNTVSAPGLVLLSDLHPTQGASAGDAYRQLSAAPNHSSIPGNSSGWSLGSAAAAAAGGNELPPMRRAAAAAAAAEDDDGPPPLISAPQDEGAVAAAVGSMPVVAAIAPIAAPRHLPTTQFSSADVGRHTYRLSAADAAMPQVARPLQQMKGYFCEDINLSRPNDVNRLSQSSWESVEGDLLR